MRFGEVHRLPTLDTTHCALFTIHRRHDADLDALRQAHAREVYMLRTECTARVSAEERDRHDAANAVATAKNELATTKLEAAHLAEDVDQLRAEAASAMAAAAAATEAAEAAHREAAQLRSSSERYTTSVCIRVRAYVYGWCALAVVPVPVPAGVHHLTRRPWT